MRAGDQPIGGGKSDWKQYVPWVVGGFLVLGGATYVFDPQGNPVRSVAAGLVFVAAGLVALPITRREIGSRAGFQLDGWLVAVIVLTGFVLGGAVLPAAESGEGAEPTGEIAPSESPSQEVEGGDDEPMDGNGADTPPADDTDDASTGDSGNDSTSNGEAPAPPPENGTGDSGAVETDDGPTTSSGQTTLRVSVTEIVDGDTVAIRYENDTTDTVRLLGVDAPEVSGDTDPREFEGVPDTRAARECLREQGDVASSYAEATLDGRTVNLSLDNQSDRRGSYGRLLAYVIVDGENFNFQLVSAGHARVYDTEFEQRERFYAAESAAQSDGVGVWSCRTAEDPERSEREDRNGSLAIASIHADAPGNDHENLNEEYIVFENRGNSTLDLSGWTIADEADHAFVFPEGTELDAGEQLTVHTGSGANTDSAVYWGSSRAIWNNDGDTITVSDDGGTVLSESYP